MADEGVEHCGQGELSRCEVTYTSTSSAVWLTAVISRPSGKGNKGDEGINFLEKRFLGWLEHIFEVIPETSTLASPKSWMSQFTPALTPSKSITFGHSKIWRNIQAVKSPDG
jgi:hypothetical protein